MIKRQFYTLEHRSRDDEASSASSSSSSEHEAAPSSEDEEALSAAHQEEDEEQQNGEASSPALAKFESSDDDKDKNEDKKCDFGLGEWGSYSLDNANDVEEISTKHHRKIKKESTKSNLSNQWADLVAETLNEKTIDFADECVVTCKTVLKCRLCPKTICLTSETMQAHLASKKHARSLKQMKEGKLKVMLNSDGEEEEQGETHAERHARTVASFKREVAKETPKRKRASGRQRQSKRAKKKAFKAKKNDKNILQMV